VLQLGKLLSSINDHIDFNFAYIGDDFTEEPKELFDPEFMKKLYKYGYNMALGKEIWHKTPPNIYTP
jgi:hypothetical protein